MPGIGIINANSLLLAGARMCLLLPSHCPLSPRAAQNDPEGAEWQIRTRRSCPGGGCPPPRGQSRVVTATHSGTQRARVVTALGDGRGGGRRSGCRMEATAQHWGRVGLGAGAGQEVTCSEHCLRAWDTSDAMETDPYRGQSSRNSGHYWETVELPGLPAATPRGDSVSRPQDICCHHPWI